MASSFFITQPIEVGMSNEHGPLRTDSRSQVEGLAKKVFNEPLLVLEDNQGHRIDVHLGTGAWWEDPEQEGAPGVRVVECQALPKVNALLGLLVEFADLKPDRGLDWRTDIAVGFRTVTVCRTDLIASLNNVALAKHSLLNGDMSTAMEKLEAALSWCWSMLGVTHPFSGEMAPDEAASLLGPEVVSGHPAQGS